MSSQNPWRADLLPRSIILIIAFVLYQLAESVALLPGRFRGQNGAAIGLILGIIMFTGLIIWIWREYRKFVRDASPADAPHLTVNLNTVLTILGGLMALIIVQSLSTYMTFSNIIPTSSNEQALTAALTVSKPVMTFIILLGAPLAEELIFRGLLMNLAFKERTRATQITNVTLSSVAFAIVHSPNNAITFLLYAAMGAVFATVYARTRDLRFGMGLHILNNLIATFI